MAQIPHEVAAAERRARDRLADQLEAAQARTLAGRFRTFAQACASLWRLVEPFPAALVRAIPDCIRYNRELRRIEQVLRRKP